MHTQTALKMPLAISVLQPPPWGYCVNISAGEKLKLGIFLRLAAICSGHLLPADNCVTDVCEESNAFSPAPLPSPSLLSAIRAPILPRKTFRKSGRRPWPPAHFAVR